MKWFAYILVGLLLVVAGGVLAQDGRGPQAVSAHPDLIRELGREQVARLHKAQMPRRMATDMQMDFTARSARVSGVGTCLFILFEFEDHPADQVNHPASAYESLMFSVDEFPTGSMNDYYREVSHGAFSIGGTVSDWTTAQNSYASYANEDGTQDAYTAREMIIDAVAQLDPVLDYSQFDNDGPDGIPDSGDDDGYVDALFFLHAGPGQEQSGDTNDIWSHAWSFWNGLNTSDGVEINRYSVEPEMLVDGGLMTMGVFAHEYGHVLGLPDLYDTDYSSAGIGEWGLMSGGSWTHREGDDPGSCPTHMTAWSKMQMGWITPVVVSADMPGTIIPPAEINPVAYRIFREGEAGGDEYFLVENRRQIGFDEGLLRRQMAYGLPAPEGLIIYHVDDTMGSNSGDTRRLVDVVDASPWFHPDGSWHENLDGERISDRWQYLDNFNRGDNGDLWPGFSAFTADSTDWVGPRDRDTFSDTSIPSAQDNECENTGVVIGNISDDGLNVTADLLVSPASGRAMSAVTADATWDFEEDAGLMLFCNSYAHVDFLHGDGCPGSGGLWFGLDIWDCPGYGNNWNDFAWITVAVETNGSPTLSLRHKYDLESNYDYGYIEIRPAADRDYGWVNIDTYNGASGCAVDSYGLPQYVLNDANVGGVAYLDIRFRLYSDGAYSAEDGDHCGIGWWIDEITVTQLAPTSAPDLPVLGDVAHLNAPNPNPFNPATTLKYHVPTGARQVTLAIFDQRGRHVRDLQAEGGAGWHEILWDGRNSSGGRVASGLYLAQLQVDGVSSVQKLALVK